MPKQRSKLQERVELYILRLIFFLVGLFPLKWSMAIGKSLARLAVHLFPRASKTAYRNLEIAYPEITPEEKKRIVLGTFASLGRQFGLITHFKRFQHEDIRELVEIVGREEVFDPAFDSGRGILFFTGHFGSWEVFNLLAPSFGYGMNILVRRLDNRLVEEYVDNIRTRFGSTTIGKKEGARSMFRILQKGEILGILADLNVQEREGVFVDFFGVPASTTTSIARLALKTNAIVIPAFAVWEEEKQKYVVYLEPPIEYEPTGDAKVDQKEITQRVTNIVENFVRKYPEQWLWSHKRWNTRPKGEKGLY